MNWPGIAEIILFACYLVLGPLIWLLYGLGSHMGITKMRLLDKPRPKPDPPPLASILIPAKDEEKRMERCLQAALDQDYPNFELIAIDDRSTDRTGAIMEEVAARDPRLRVLHIQPGSLGPGWTGKNNALYQGTKLANGKWLLFVDSDVLVEPNALSRCLALCNYKKYELFSVLPALEAHTIWERIMIPLCSMAATVMYLGIFINNDRRGKTPFANGQFMMSSKAAYDAVGGHETVKDRICEDTELARVMLERGFRVRVSMGGDVCTVRMYDSLPKIIKGWSRIYYAARVGKFRHIVAAILLVLICCFPVYPAMGYGISRALHPQHNVLDFAWLAAAAVHFAAMTAVLGAQYRITRNSWLHALLLPVSGPILLWILFKALVMCITNIVEWRGTRYSHKMAEKLAVK